LVKNAISSRLELTALDGFPLVKKGDDLADLIQNCLQENGIGLMDGDVLVVAQKVISKAEGRQVKLADVVVSKSAEELGRATDKDPRLVELILRESSQILRTRPGLIIAEHKRGFICANAGIDRSNVSQPEGIGSESVLLLPEDADRSARDLRAALEDGSETRIGILVIDSHGRAWRNGTVGVSIGLSGIPGVVDMRGEKDLFGYELQVTEVAAADELAAGASLLMGQAKEGRPVVHVRGFPYPLRDGSFDELPRDRERDLFR
jgi:coenzyme F420-0:L-glutamate ligase/coenzyme F420-1:gamma-L-glutamate ligase